MNEIRYKQDCGHDISSIELKVNHYLELEAFEFFFDVFLKWASVNPAVESAQLTKYLIFFAQLSAYQQDIANCRSICPIQSNAHV